MNPATDHIAETAQLYVERAFGLYTITDYAAVKFPYHSEEWKTAMVQGITDLLNNN